MNYLALLGAVLCAMASGYLFGGSTPGWEGDAPLDGRYGGGGGSPVGYGWNNYDFLAGAYLTGCFAHGMRGSGLALLLAIAAVVLMYGYSGFGSNQDMLEEGGWFIALLDRRTWGLLISAAIGYIFAVARDKGPVGPLQ